MRRQEYSDLKLSRSFSPAQILSAHPSPVVLFAPANVRISAIESLGRSYVEAPCPGGFAVQFNGCHAIPGPVVSRLSRNFKGNMQIIKLNYMRVDSSGSYDNYCGPSRNSHACSFN